MISTARRAKGTPTNGNQHDVMRIREGSRLVCPREAFSPARVFQCGKYVQSNCPITTFNGNFFAGANLNTTPGSFCLLRMRKAIHPLKRVAIEVATKDCSRLCNTAPLQHMIPQIGEDEFSALFREKRTAAGWAVVVDDMQWGGV